MAHLGDGEYRGEVANLTRNVVVESADPDGVRGHTMYHRNCAGSHQLRRVPPPRQEGRARPVRAALPPLRRHDARQLRRRRSIWDSHNRWLTIHGTNYLVVRDCVGYKSVGHGFFLEDGTEVYNVLDRNLAVGATRGKRLPKQVLPFDENEGAGFWWANSLNTFTRNVAAESDQYGFRFEATPIERAEAHASRSGSPTARARNSTSARCRSSASRTTRSTVSTACTASTSARASTASARTRSIRSSSAT